ncbi:MAG: metallophosphoesterase [Deltaproteobacteria bacterium]|nr:MAG: metallophosphoesterase [Deltaproteobacteria bacterium]
MTLFVITALLIYTAMHLVVFWGMHPLLARHRALPTLSWVLMVPMIFAPVGVRLLERYGYEWGARALAWTSFTWMGFLFIAFSMFIILFAFEILFFILKRITPLPRLSLRSAQSAAIIFIITLTAGIYSLHEATDMRVERISLQAESLGGSAKKITVAQLSDIHLGLMNRENILAPIVSKLQELKPDIVLATGDVVDAQINHIDELSDLWLRIDPPLGKYAVLGNHEYYAGLKQSIEFLEKSGFKVLRGESDSPRGEVTIIGVDDSRDADNSAIIRELDSPLYTIYMKHRPKVIAGELPFFDLQLSGHAHKGQIFPFNFLTAIPFPMQDGLYPLPRENYLYASRGTGTWGPPMRLLSPPEISIFELTKP